MIKIKVEWRYRCPSCGTELVSDFFADSAEGLSCPWCGSMCPDARSSCDDEIKSYIERVVRETEQRANGILTAQS
ncbi:hypothetical protein LLG46_01150 [bacterium]|nr:hypothetical protein [bacterium]